MGVAKGRSEILTSKDCCRLEQRMMGEQDTVSSLAAMVGLDPSSLVIDRDFVSTSLRQELSKANQNMVLSPRVVMIQVLRKGPTVCPFVKLLESILTLQFQRMIKIVQS